MTTERLKQIKQKVENRLDQAQQILEGGENYDGADGARYIRDLCAICDELIEAVTITENL